MGGIFEPGRHIFGPGRNPIGQAERLLRRSKHKARVSGHPVGQHIGCGRSRPALRQSRRVESRPRARLRYGPAARKPALRAGRVRVVVRGGRVRIVPGSASAARPRRPAASSGRSDIPGRGSAHRVGRPIRTGIQPSSGPMSAGVPGVRQCVGAYCLAANGGNVQRRYVSSVGRPTHSSVGLSASER